MKRQSIILLVSLFVASLNVQAQKANETVYLKNGSVIKGTIVEQVPNESLKIRTADGSLFVYQMSEVTKITKEEVPTKQTVIGDDKHRGLDFGINAGYLIGVGDAKDANSPSVEFSLGKQLNKNLYLGLGAGAWIPTGDGDLQIPVSVDSKIMFPLRSSNVTPLGIVRLGYVINTAGDKEIDGMGYVPDQTVEAENAFMLQIMPGIELPLSKRTDFLLAAGYTHAFTDGGGGGYFSLKAGFNFHKNQSLKKRPKRPKAPVREKGFEMTFEGGVNYCEEMKGGANLIFGYKFNPHLSLGLGLGFEGLALEEESYQIIRSSYRGENYVEENKKYTDPLLYPKVFIRGQYRLSSKRFSPTVSCDVGWRIYREELEDEYEHSYSSYSSNIPSPDKNGLYASPAIGVSLRTTNNSYLELKAGYTFAKEVLGQKGVVEKIYNENKYYTYYACQPTSVSAAFVTLGFTHTFGKRPARPPRPE